MKPVVLGLGNPGEEYEKTYHNVGKLFVKYWAEKEGVAIKDIARKHFSAGTSTQFVFAAPRTFMNTSGGAAHEALEFFAITPQLLTVAYDDSDLQLGTYKYTRGGGSAGHHGIDSITATISTNDFMRIRIGIRDPNEIERRKAGEFVLHPITTAHMKTLYGVFDTIIIKLIENEIPRSLETTP